MVDGMKKLALLLVVGVSLGLAPVATASYPKDPTPRHAYRAVARCAHRVGASQVVAQPGGGEMWFGVEKTALASLLEQFAPTIQWQYSIGKYGRVDGVLVVKVGSVPWGRLNACLDRTFGPGYG